VRVVGRGYVDAVRNLEVTHLFIHGTLIGSHGRLGGWVSVTAGIVSKQLILS